jgi:nucleoside-diphosphate-sugar epimerase
MRVLVTGASGFVGSALCAHLTARGLLVRRAVRSVSSLLAGDSAVVGEIGPDTDWDAALRDVNAVVHLAARVHTLRETATDPLAEYRRVNLDGTRRLAAAAASQRVTRLVFVSSSKVNGETSARPFTESDPPRPEDPYARSKWEAEQALAQIGNETGLEYAILRPPLVYGPGVGANFARLMQWVARGVPLPLGAIDNRRSLVYVGNLVDAIRVCLAHPAAVGRTFLVSDGEDVSTPELVRGIARALGVAPRLLPVPVSLLRLAASTIGRRHEIERLAGSLQVDSSAIRRELSWSPPATMRDGLAETARWFRTLTG